jgi:hypothetical protein
MIDTSIFEQERQQTYDDAVEEWHADWSLPIPVLPLTISEARRDYLFIWLAVRRLLPQLHEEVIATVVSIAVGICPYCREAPAGHDCPAEYHE